MQSDYANFRYGRSIDRPTSSSFRFDPLIALQALVAALLLWALTMASVALGAATNGPLGMVQNTVTQAVEVLKDRHLPAAERRDRLLQVVSPHFDFADMARSSLGAHWKELSPPQQEQFVQTFTAFMEDAYLNQLDSYSGETIEFVGQTMNAADDAEVSTRVIETNHQDPITLDYRVKRAGGNWKVYDVVIDSISITANYRNQFNRVINDRGYNALMNEMRIKQKQLIASLAH